MIREILYNWQLGINLGSMANLRSAVNHLRFWAKFQGYMYMFSGRDFPEHPSYWKALFFQFSWAECKDFMSKNPLRKALEIICIVIQNFFKGWRIEEILLHINNSSSPRIPEVIGKPNVPQGLLGCPRMCYNCEMWSG